MALNSSSSFSATHQRRSNANGMNRLIRAAEKGDASSQFNLGIVYDNNLDDNHHPAGGNRTKAIGWLRKAARQGLPRAQSRLAELYADGPDAPKNDVPACAWFTLAAKNSTGASRHRAESGYARVASRMTQAQIAKAACFVRNWVPKPQGEAVTPANGGNFSEKRPPGTMDD